MVNAFIVAEVLGICIIFAAMVLLITDDSGAREQKLMGYFLCGAAVQNGGYLLELTAPALEAAVSAVKMQYLGSTFVPLCYCWFIYSYCFRKAPRIFLDVLGILDVIMLGLIYSCDYHSLYYKNIEWLETSSGHHYLGITYGPVYYLFLFSGCIIPYVLSFFTLIRAIHTQSGIGDSRKYRIILGLSVLPTVSLFAYAGKITYVFDPTPVVLGLTLSLVVILIWKRRTYDYRHLASGVLIDSMSDGVVALDSQRRILNYNHAATLIFPGLAGYNPGDYVEEHHDIKPGMLKEDHKVTFELNNRIYESHTKQILDKSGQNQGWVLLILDITETTRYIEEIKRVREEAERANAAKSEFLAKMSHEIRTPMNAIVGLSDIIMEESLGRKVYSYACDIKSASRNLLSIINDILDLSKVEAGKMELVTSDYHVKSVVDEVVHMMSIAASQRGLSLRHEYDTSIPCRYNGDAGRIKQILINILNNAVKFTKEGFVKVSIGGEPGRTLEEEILIFRIQDSGCGIRKEDQEKIFDNFQQVGAKKNYSTEGTGLGLSITKHFVELMGGTIELYSVYGVGTTFTVTIPQRIVDRRSLEELPKVSGVEEEKMEVFVAKQYKVLVVDDNLINRKVAKGFLSTYQFKIWEAESGYEAIDMVKSMKFDMIFMDHMMPEMDGIETVQIIRRDCGENGQSPVIVGLTANAMEGVREQFLESGFQDFLTKPLDKLQLNKVLVEWVSDEFKELPEEEKEAAFVTPDDESGGIAGIDKSAVIKYQGGFSEDYRELLQLFVLDGKRKLTLLEKLFREKDLGQYGVEVHGLKSASANIGAVELSEMFLAHEKAAGSGDGEFVAEHFQELLLAYQEQMGQIRKFLDEKEEKTDNVREKIADIDKKTVLREVRAALDLLLSFRSKECLKKVENLLCYNLSEELAAKLSEIKAQLKLYEDTEAEQLLYGLLNWINEEEL
ncbi:MAG: ATP-binding protein [Roseburia sp.]|nr:ATP-binding protein [Roseburia sp.]